MEEKGNRVEILKLLEEGTKCQNNEINRAKEAYRRAQLLSQKFEFEDLNLISGFNLGTCLVNSGEPRAGVEQLLKILSLLPGIISNGFSLV